MSDEWAAFMAEIDFYHHVLRIATYRPPERVVATDRESRMISTLPVNRIWCGDGERQNGVRRMMVLVGHDALDPDSQGAFFCKGHSLQ